MSAETNRQNGRVYLDHAATTDVLPAAIDAMVEQMRNGGNPSSLHAVGRDARATVEYARERIARAIGADPAEVIFTSGGTEADNLAVKGIYWKRREEDPQRTRILVSSIEHHAVEETCEWLEKAEGAQLEWIPVDEHGSVNPQTVRELIEKNPEDVALVTVMWANNEVGTVQPIPEIAAIAAEYGIPVHSDAVQAFGAVPIDFHASGVATLAISGHKIGGPMGIGALVATRAVQMTPCFTEAARNAPYAPAPSTHPPSQVSQRPPCTRFSTSTKNPPASPRYATNSLRQLARSSRRRT